MSQPAAAGGNRWQLVEVLPWCAWAALTLGALSYVHHYSVNCPIWEEWGMAPALTGQRPLLSWLWAQNNEHRLPLPRLIFYVLTVGSGHDFRAGMYANVAALAALALGLMATVRKLRGRSILADSFFPLVLLHRGHYENFLMSDQLAYVCPVVLAGIVLVAICGQGSRPRTSLLVVGGVCLLLPLCGASGMVLFSAPALWVCGVSAVRWRQAAPGEKRGAAAAGMLAGVSLLLAGVYLVGFERPAGIKAAASLGRIANISLECLAMSLGPGLIPHWPVAATVMLALLLLSGALLLAAWRRCPLDRARVLGLVLFLSGSTGLALAIGWGRAAFGDNAGLAPRYALLMAPLLCAVYFAVQRYSAARVCWLLQTALCLLLGVCYELNARDARIFGHWRRHNLQAFQHDLYAGVPVPTLVERHGAFLFPPKVGLEHYLRVYLDARVGMFKSVPVSSSSHGISSAAEKGWPAAPSGSRAGGETAHRWPGPDKP
jgi:hypothetical protein